jgi:hypothetical protein
MTATLAKTMTAICASISLLACVTSASSAEPAIKASARSLPEGVAARSTSIVSNTVAVVEVPQSVFVDRPQGKDPFFPDADYRKQLKKESKRPSDLGGDAILATLKLTGFGGIGNKRWAMINGVAIYEGESSSVRVGNSLRQIECLEMKEQSVVVGIKDDPARRELKLDN